MMTFDHVVAAVDFSPAMDPLLQCLDVLRTATVPVLLDRIEPAAAEDAARCAAVCQQKFSRPLLATDFSESARGTEQMALTLTEQADSAVFMVVRDAGESALTVEAARAQLEALAERAACPITVRVERSNKASTAIAQVAEEEDSSVLLVGKHGRGYLEEYVLGSTAQNLTKWAKRPVLMVPASVAGTQKTDTERDAADMA